MEGRTRIIESIAFKNIPIDSNKFTFKQMYGVNFLVPDSREKHLFGIPTPLLELVRRQCGVVHQEV
jgi:hypothetical protein